MSRALQGDGARVGAGESFSGVSSITHPPFLFQGACRTQLPHRSSTAGFLWMQGNAE